MQNVESDHARFFETGPGVAESRLAEFDDKFRFDVGVNMDDDHHYLLRKIVYLPPGLQPIAVRLHAVGESRPQKRAVSYYTYRGY
ncbi:MAG TPA: hypothetical protein P5300_08650 [Acidobacteriota bacterium]|nr:hypothetical protein [Acidobacteriota bacterium]